MQMLLFRQHDAGLPIYTSDARVVGLEIEGTIGDDNHGSFDHLPRRTSSPKGWNCNNLSEEVNATLIKSSQSIRARYGNVIDTCGAFSWGYAKSHRWDWLARSSERRLAAAKGHTEVSAPKVLDVRGFQWKWSYNFGPWNKYLRFVVTGFWGIVAFNWGLDCILKNSLGLCPGKWPGLASRTSPPYKTNNLVSWLASAERSIFGMDVTTNGIAH